MGRKTISDKVRFKVLSRDRFTCQYCGRSAPDVVLHIDHVVPVSRGGTNDMSNLVAACSQCNLGKSNMELSACEEGDALLRERLRNMDRMNAVVIGLIGKWRMNVTLDPLSGDGS